MTTKLHQLPPNYSQQRVLLQTIATHVLAKRRFDAIGRFGLTATPGGLGTLAYGDGNDVVRFVRQGVVIDSEKTTRVLSWADVKTIEEIAGFVNVKPDESFSAGKDTPKLLSTDDPISVEPAVVAFIGDWLTFTWSALDSVSATVDETSRTQLWPEHFDAGLDAPWGNGENHRSNFGGSCGDSGIEEPYLYVGPWGDERPGDKNYWTHSFGAVVTHSQLLESTDPVSAATDFFLRGLALLKAG